MQSGPRRLGDRHPVLVLAVVVMVAVWSLGAAGCGTSPSADESSDAQAYESVVRWLLDAHPAATPAVGGDDGDDDDGDGDGDGGSTPVPLYLDALSDRTIPLEIQVAVIEQFPDVDTVRFIDDRVEAVDVDAPGRPVHDNGALVALGPIGTENPTTVRAELYRDDGTRAAYLFTLARTGDGWRVDGDPEPVPVEGLVDDDG